MSNANLLITLLVIFSSFLAVAQDEGFEPIKEVGQFKAHMLDHPFEGCPTNSLCVKEMGNLRKSWLKTLSKKNPYKGIERFRKKNGMPLKIWTRDKVLKEPTLIMWDSFCPKHNPKPSSEGLINTEEKIYIAEAWYKNFGTVLKSFKEGDQILVNRAYVLEKDKSVTTYIIPRAEAPLFISDKKLYFTIEEEGHYFGLWISPNGKLRADQTYLPKNFPTEKKCPEELSKAFSAGIKNPKLYQGFFCKAIWDQSSKKFKTIALGWSCN